MNIENKFPVMVFAREYQGRTYYSIGLSKKDKNGNWINGYKECQFKKDVKVENKTQIYIKKAWIDFWLDKDNKTHDFIFICEFETVENTIKKSKEEEVVEKGGTINMEEIVITDKDLPF